MFWLFWLQFCSLRVRYSKGEGHGNFREGQGGGERLQERYYCHHPAYLLCMQKWRNCEHLTMCYCWLRYSLFLHLSGRCENGKDHSVLAGVPYTPLRAPFCHADNQFCRLAISRLRFRRRREGRWRSERKGATKYSVALITPLTTQSFDFHWVNNLFWK